MESNATRAIEHLRQESEKQPVLRGLPDPKVFGDFPDRCESMFDPEWGGFGGAPKSPRPALLRTLMQLSERFGTQGDEGRMA